MPRIMAPFRYWGSKVRMARWIIERLPEHEHFVETCAGSAAVMAAKPRSMFETVNDVYHEVTNFFRVLRSEDTATQLIDLVAFTPYSHEEFIAAATIEPTDDAVVCAYKFFMRMQMAVVPGRTGWSYSVSGKSAKKANKPGRWTTMPEHLKKTAERFNRIQVTSWPIEQCLARMDKPGILHFVDPPYINDTRPTSTGSSSAYAHDSFDHEKFVNAVAQMENADVIVVHYPHRLYDNGPWRVIGDYESHRNIPNGQGREKAVERLYQHVRK